MLVLNSLATTFLESKEGILATSKMSTSRRSLSSTLGKRSFPVATSSSSANPPSELSAIPESSFVSTSAHSILPVSSSPPPQPAYSYSNQRSQSPPASSYFPSVAATQSGEPQPSPGAATHFAYSTTLRRHHHDASLSLQLPPNLADITSTEGLPSLWQKAKGVITRRFSQGTTENRYELLPTGGRASQPPKSREDHRETPSARFAHWTVEDTLAYFRTSSVSGLPSASIQALQAVHGYNEFSVSAPESTLLKFAKTIYENPLILLLCGSAVISAAMGNIDDAVSITVAVLIVLTVGFVQEQRSEKSLEALNKLVPHHCHVIRDQREIHILANELVPGDIVSLSSGDRVPADMRIIMAVDLEVDESSLTGETNARRKDSHPCISTSTASVPDGPVNSGDIALAERSCIGYMGTLVRNGRGMGVVIATGTQTEFGVIFSMMQDVEEKRTPLQLSMDELAKKLSIISFGIIGVICVIGLWQQRPWLDMFTIGVSLAVAAIPEGLPIVTTVTLALGVLRMSKRKAIVKKLHSVEALGSISVICSDKTGTLTKNEQTVTEIYVVDETIQVDDSRPSISPAVRKVLEIGSLCNNASNSRDGDGKYVGQSTDVALLNVLSSFDLPDQRLSFTRLSEKPFNSEQKYMAVSGVHSYSATLYSGTPHEMYYIKGSIDAILDRCKFYFVKDGSPPALDAGTRNVILTNAQATASRGLRVIAMAYGYGSIESPRQDSAQSQQPTHRASQSMPVLRTPAPDEDKNNLVFAGFQAMFDPPRKGVADAIALLQSGGVQVVMITGDAEQTALAIAQKLGLRVGPPGGQIRSYCLTGKDLDQMSKAQLIERVGSVSVFARTTPRHKMAIVEAFQARGAIVAMTGDGVNDAPALKMADIGVSMGKSGTDVAKEAADAILVDDNFSTILPAVEEGKSIFHNIQNFLSFQLSTAAAALTLITLSTLFGYSNPLNANQILFINILMDGPPSQSLGVDPVDPAVMRRPPRKKNEPIITKQLLYRVFFSAATIVCGTAFIYTTALGDDLVSRREQTKTFTCFVFLDLVSAVQNRGLGCGLVQNKMLLTTVSVSFLVQLALVYIPLMQAIFQTEALGSRDLLTILLIAATSFVLHEGRRRFERSVQADETYASVVEEMA
ncbi:calcium-transporting P [Rhizopogon vinicolor AM-OR11-026]|uniref:Calcium-transporting ATPase 1 n=1 Tax=Rhizopogon vinicolor AM-OR11-026 TaxID=1314800 RepID=A0A1B7MPE9_9AGAM|nr:calcium-transporting P [Rhizopogon vinicolor AM-OR11-026]